MPHSPLLLALSCSTPVHLMHQHISTCSQPLTAPAHKPPQPTHKHATHDCLLGQQSIMHAHRGHPTWSAVSMLASFAKSSSTTPEWPLHAAECRGVRPIWHRNKTPSRSTSADYTHHPCSHSPLQHARPPRAPAHLHTRATSDCPCTQASTANPQKHHTRLRSRSTIHHARTPWTPDQVCHLDVGIFRQEQLHHARVTLARRRVQRGPSGLASPQHAPSRITQSDHSHHPCSHLLQHARPPRAPAHLHTLATSHRPCTHASTAHPQTRHTRLLTRSTICHARKPWAPDLVCHLDVGIFRQEQLHHARVAIARGPVQRGPSVLTSLQRAHLRPLSCLTRVDNGIMHDRYLV